MNKNPARNRRAAVMVIAMDKLIYWQELYMLSPRQRGFHLITTEIKEQLQKAPTIQTGLLHLFLQHTSASLLISENTCKEVPLDLEAWFNQLVPDSDKLYQHNEEGPDDMPAHIKNSILGVSLTIPINKGQLALGQWQGIFLCEHRNAAPGRRIVMTLQGE